MADDAQQVTAATTERARYQVAGLMFQFVLGMVVYVAGLPAHETGDRRIVGIVFLVIHALVAAGLVTGAAIIAAATTGTRGWPRRLALAGAGAIAVATVTGVLTVAAGNGWWAYLMGVGFLAAVVAYGGILVQAIAAGPAAQRRTAGWPAGK